MKMFRAMILALGFLTMSVLGEAANSTSVCPKGYWGTSCANYCGYCNSEEPSKGIYDRVCDSVTGKCIQGCQGGWTGQKCEQAICDDGCNGGECIYPEVCGNCPSISHVSPGCTNIKLRGLLGSLAAFAVLIFSLCACALGAMFYERRKNTPVTL